jgi:hypothetical protein
VAISAAPLSTYMPLKFSMAGFQVSETSLEIWLVPGEEVI